MCRRVDVAGALSKSKDSEERETETGQEAESPAALHVSKSRANFLKQHLDSTPLFHKWADEEAADKGASSTPKSTFGSLVKQLGKSAVVNRASRLIKSQTFGDGVGGASAPSAGSRPSRPSEIVSNIADELASSPSISNLVNQASKFKEKVS